MRSDVDCFLRLGLLLFLLALQCCLDVSAWMSTSSCKPTINRQLYIDDQYSWDVDSQIHNADESSKQSFQEQDNRHDDIIESSIKYFSRHGNGSSTDPPNDGSTKSIDDKYNGRANVELGPGWGKTMLSLQILAKLAKSSQVRSALYVVPTLVLVDQVFEEIEKFGSLQDTPHRFLIVASQTSRRDVRCTTSNETIASFLQSSMDDEKLAFIVCTYKSLGRVGEAVELSGAGSIDFCTFDEAHVMEGAGNMTGYGLYDSLLPIHRRLFLTATPRRYVENPDVRGVLGTRLTKDGSRAIIPSTISPEKQTRPIVRSFDDKSFFGPCLARRSLRESTAANITVPITLWVLDRREMCSILDRPIDNNLESKDYLLAFAVEAAFKKLNVSHAVSFHSTNSRSLAFAESARSAFTDDITVLTVNGTGSLSASKRQAILSLAESAERSLVTNCRVLSEGVNKAQWEMVVMADSVRSSVLARQMVGRVTRTAPNKDRGYLLVPLLVEDSSELLSDNSAGYETFFNAFEAMVWLDPILRQEVLFVSDKSEALGRDLGANEFPQHVVDAFRLPPNLPLWLKTKMVNRVIREYNGGSSWGFMFSLLVAYRKREGHCNVHVRHREDGQYLGQWVQYQRMNRKNGKLDLNRARRLEDVGFVWDVLGHQWEQMFVLLEQYKQREGHCNVNRGHQEDGQYLGRWLSNQRRYRKDGKLDLDRARRLESVGIVWSVLRQQWEQMFVLLEQYKQREGHCNVNARHREDGENLGRWVHEQRKNRKNGKLDLDRSRRLEDVGIVWHTKWERMFALLEQYKQRQGHCNVHFGHQEDGENLGNWVHEQRKNRKNGKLDLDRSRRLESVGIVWHILGPKWERMFALLEQYKQREGHCNVPFGHQEDGENLGQWVNTQRENPKNGKLDLDRAKRLDNAGFMWDIRPSSAK